MNETYIFLDYKGLVQAADNAIDTLRRMRAGMKVDRKKKRPIKDEVSLMFRGKKQREWTRNLCGNTSFFVSHIRIKSEFPHPSMIKKNCFKQILEKKKLNFMHWT